MLSTSVCGQSTVVFSKAAQASCSPASKLLFKGFFAHKDLLPPGGIPPPLSYFRASRSIFRAFPKGSGQPLALCTTATVLPVLITYSFCFQLFVNLLTFFVFRAKFAIDFPDSYRVFYWEMLNVFLEDKFLFVI
jgi:hypothetical protein